MGRQGAGKSRLVRPDGSVYVGELSPDAQVRAWARLVHRGTEGLVEVVAGRRRADGGLSMRSRGAADHFPGAGDLAALCRLAARHRTAGEEVFATPATRRERRAGKAGGVLGARVAWVDIDDPQRLADLRAFAHRPHMVLYTGSGGAHAYWRLTTMLAPAALEATNRKLAAALGGDPSVCDRARIMRLPGTHNHKADRPCRLAFCDLHRTPVAVEELVAGLADPRPPRPTPRLSESERRRRAALVAADPASEIAPPSYFAALAGVELPATGGHVGCPLPDHDDALASCMVYADPERGWWCYGCERGGRIYDLAALMAGGAWGRDLRGDEFRAAKALVAERLGLPDAAAEASAPAAR